MHSLWPSYERHRAHARPPRANSKTSRQKWMARGVGGDGGGGGGIGRLWEGGARRIGTKLLFAFLYTARNIPALSLFVQVGY